MEQEKVWDKIAESWSEFRKEISPSVQKFLIEQNGKVLDLGCGSGRNFIKNENQQLYGIDFSKEMLKYAKKRAEELKVNVNLKQAETCKLPFEDNFFDSIICWAVMHCIETEKKRKQTLKEIHRVLKPSGQALISTWSRNSPRLKNKDKECSVPWSTKTESKEERYTYIYDLEEFKNQLKEQDLKLLDSGKKEILMLSLKKFNCNY